jgi:hypothetical protein
MSAKRKNKQAPDKKPRNPSAADTIIKLQQVLEAERLRIVKFVETIHKQAYTWEEMEKIIPGEKEKALCRQMIDSIDEWLAELCFRIPSEIRIRAQRSQHKSLLSLSVADAYQGIGDLPGLLERLPESEWDHPESSDCTGFNLLDNLAKLIRFIEKDARKHSERYRFWAREQPFFPMMVFCNSSAYRWRFSEIIKLVELGKRCPINVSERAQFRFDIPINVLVYEALVEIYSWAFSWIKDARVEDPEEKWRKGATVEDRLAEQAGMPKVLQPVYQMAFDLQPLTKSNAKEWADKVMIPHFESVHPDWKKVEALAPYIGKAGGRAKAKEAIYEAVKSLAKPILS